MYIYKEDLKFTTCECYKFVKFVDSGEYAKNCLQCVGLEFTIRN